MLKGQWDPNWYHLCLAKEILTTRPSEGIYNNIFSIHQAFFTIWSMWAMSYRFVSFCFLGLRHWCSLYHLLSSKAKLKPILARVKSKWIATCQEGNSNYQVASWKKKIFPCIKINKSANSLLLCKIKRKEKDLNIHFLLQQPLTNKQISQKILIQANQKMLKQNSS